MAVNSIASSVSTDFLLELSISVVNALERRDADVALVVERPPHLIQRLIVEVGIGVGNESVVLHGLVELVLVEEVLADAEISFRHEPRLRV